MCLGLLHFQRRFFYCTYSHSNFTVLNTSKRFRNLFVIFVGKQRQSCQVHTEHLLHCKRVLRPSLGFVRFNEAKPPVQCSLLPLVSFWQHILQLGQHASVLSLSLQCHQLSPVCPAPPGAAATLAVNFLLE